MKCWSPFFVFSLLWASALAALSNQEMQNMLKAKGRSGTIHLSDENYAKVLYGQRDYHLILFLTSQMPQFNCVLCREIAPFFEIVAKSYQHTYPDGVGEDGKDVYFLVSEISDSKRFFHVLKVNSIPKVYHFPPSVEGAKTKSFLEDNHLYEFFQGDHVDLLSSWVASTTGHKINIHIPPNYSKIALNALVAFTVALAIRRFHYQVFAVLKSSFVWGALSIVFILLFLAGQMFNQIRNTPFVKEDGNKKEFVASSAHMQYAVETQVVSTLYGLLGLAFLILVARVSKIANPKVQFIAAAVLSVTLYVLYGIFLDIFGFKYDGYPFKFFNYLGF